MAGPIPASQPSACRSAHPAIAGLRLTTRSARPTSWPSARRSATTVATPASPGPCSSGSTRTPSPARRWRPRSKCSPPTTSTWSSTSMTATRRPRSSRMPSWPIAAAGRGGLADGIGHRANALLEGSLVGVRRVPFARAIRTKHVHRRGGHVQDLSRKLRNRGSSRADRAAGAGCGRIRARSLRVAGECSTPDAEP